MKPEEIKALRLNLRLSQQSFSTLVGVGYVTLSRWERGVSKPSPMAIKILHRIMRDSGYGND